MESKPTVTFFSNFLLHHQTPFCEAMVALLGDNFHFVATEEMPEERVQMGYLDYRREPYAVNAYESAQQYEKAMELGRNSDVVMIGSAPDVFIQDRLTENKLTFRYYERFFKQGRIRILDPRVLRARYVSDIRHRKKNLHMLCASAYTAPDCRFIGAYPNKTYKWGYFPPVKKYDNVENLIGLKHPASILWVGRLIGLKHPEYAVKLAQDLERLGEDFTLTIIGQGEMEEKLKTMIAQKHLSHRVTLEGFMPPEQVRQRMEQADIFLFTSDHNEGWGAVLNESMNSACAVVANREIGSVPYLINDGVNGLIYDRRKKGSLTNCVLKLLRDADFKHTLQKNAYETLTTTWNAQEAAKRLLHLIEDIQSGSEPRFESGPCSRD